MGIDWVAGVFIAIAIVHIGDKIVEQMKRANDLKERELGEENQN